MSYPYEPLKSHLRAQWGLRGTWRTQLSFLLRTWPSSSLGQSWSLTVVRVSKSKRDFYLSYWSCSNEISYRRRGARKATEGNLRFLVLFHLIPNSAFFQHLNEVLATFQHVPFHDRSSLTNVVFAKGFDQKRMFFF